MCLGYAVPGQGRVSLMPGLTLVGLERSTLGLRATSVSMLTSSTAPREWSVVVLGPTRLREHVADLSSSDASWAPSAERRRADTVSTGVEEADRTSFMRQSEAIVQQVRIRRVDFDELILVRFTVMVVWRLLVYGALGTIDNAFGGSTRRDF